MSKVTDEEIESVLKRSDYSETKRFAMELKDARAELKELRKVNEHNIKGLIDGTIKANNVSFVVGTVGRVEP